MKAVFMTILAVPFFIWAFANPEDEVLIPAGKVVLGNYPEGYGNYPARTVLVSDFYMDRFEVTNQQYAAFVDSGGYRTQAYWIISDQADSLAGWRWKEENQLTTPKFWSLQDSPYWKNDPYSKLPNAPVIGVNWFEANAYTKWAGKRLPTAAEWEKAARGASTQFGTLDGVGVGFKYPWGNNFFKEQVPPNYQLCNWRLAYYAYRFPDIGSRAAETGYAEKTWQADGYRESVALVGSFSPQGNSPYDISDLAGNAWEWTATPYPKYEEQLKIIKGGGWYGSTLEHLKTGYQYGMGPYLRSKDIGFRCVRNQRQ